MPPILLEYTVKQLIRKAEPKMLFRSTGLISTFLFVKKKTILYFVTVSATDPNRGYYQQINLVDLSKAIEKAGGTKKAVKHAVDVSVKRGNIKVHCDCPAFKYWGYKYILGGMDALYGKREPRFPKRNNPKLKGSLCKHMVKVLDILDKNLSKITQEVKRHV